MSNHHLLLLNFLCFSLLLPLAIYILIKCQTKRNKTLPLPPGPKPWPILGSLPEMLKNRPTFRWIHELMDEMNTEIMCIRFGNVHVIPVTSPEIAREFLKQHDSVFSTRPFFVASEILSGGYLTIAVTPFGEQWKKMRKILVSGVLSSARHRWLQAKRDEESDHLVRYVYNKCKTADSLVDLRVVTQHYCGNMIRKLVFGKRFFGKGAEDGGPGVEEEEHVKGIFTALRHLFSFCVTDYVPCLRGYIDFDDHEKKMRAACASLRKYQDPLIDERIRQWREGEKNEIHDILDVLVTSRDDNGEPLLRSEEIKAQLMETMIAVVDNPSNTVEWALAEMLNQPNILKTAQEELDRVVGTSRLVQESDISQLNYLKACIKESFRLHPINPFNVPHVSNSNTNVGGFFIPKGSHVLLSRSGMGRNPRVWPEPLRFRPDRHLLQEGRGDVVLTDHDLRILSFSTGRRGCPGSTLGSTITVMLLARLIHSFSFSLPPGVAKIELRETHDGLELLEPLILMGKPRLDKNLLVGAYGMHDGIIDECTLN